jgi:hypothetical protein
MSYHLGATTMNLNTMPTFQKQVASTTLTSLSAAKVRLPSLTSSMIQLNSKLIQGARLITQSEASKTLSTAKKVGLDNSASGGLVGGGKGSGGGGGETQEGYGLNLDALPKEEQELLCAAVKDGSIVQVEGMTAEIVTYCSEWCAKRPGASASGSSMTMPLLVGAAALLVLLKG